MRVLCSPANEGLKELRFEERPSPAPGPGQVRVKVKAVGLNRADLLQVLGFYPAPAGVAADVPGLEYAGEVDAFGVGVTRWKLGDRVMGLVAGGAFADHLLTHEHEALAVPAGMDFTEAAALPEAFITAFDALSLQGGLRGGDRVLIHAAGSGVGSAAVQWAKSEGAMTIGTSRTRSKLDKVTPLGLDVGLEVRDAKFSDAVKHATAGRGVNLVLELVGGDYFAESIAACAHRATIMVVGLTAGATTELSLRTLLQKRLTVRGTTLRSRPLEEKLPLMQAVRERLVPKFEAGVLKPVIGERVSFEQIPAALERMGTNETFGKTVATL